MLNKSIHIAALLTSGVVGLTIPACGEGEATPDDGVLRGELAVYVADTLDGKSETSYYLRDAAGDEQRLFFSSAARWEAVRELAPGAPIQVRGAAFSDGIEVSWLESPSDRAEVVRSPLIGATPNAPRSFAFVLVDLGQGVNTNATTAMGRLIGDADSIRNYYLYDSYGTQDITAQVFGPIKYSLPSCSNNDTRNLATSLRTMIPGTFNHYLWYFGQRTTTCEWAGLGSVGTSQSPARDTWYNGSTSCVVLVQEPGHNFGMQHSSSLRCGSAAYADDPNGCTVSEYGDIFDPMGGGCRHMNAWQKAYQGWFGGCNGVRVSASATYTLLPLESACNGTQFLQIKSPKTRMLNRPAAGGGSATTESLGYYYVELRAPIDFDGTLGNRSGLTPTVLVRVGNDLRNRNQAGLHTFLLDMKPSTSGSSSGFNDAGLVAGQTFEDPAGGLSITATAVSATSATIEVKYTVEGAAPTCLDGSAFTPPGAVTCGDGPGTGGTGGSTGAAGAGGGAGAGAGGATGGRGGAAGAQGAAGRGGVGGGAGGRGGSAGGAGGSGVAGQPGRGGTTGEGGTTAVGGRAGEAQAGTAGQSSITGGGDSMGAGHGGGVGQKEPLIGGCDCDSGGAGGFSASGVFALGILGIALPRARRRHVARARKVDQ